jgi:hypothetical protein
MFIIILTIFIIINLWDFFLLALQFPIIHPRDIFHFIVQFFQMYLRHALACQMSLMLEKRGEVITPGY